MNWSDAREDLLDSDIVYDSGAADYGRWLGYVENDSGVVAFDSGAEVLRPTYLLTPCCPHLVSMSDGCWKCERIGLPPPGAAA